MELSTAPAVPPGRPASPFDRRVPQSSAGRRGGSRKERRTYGPGGPGPASASGPLDQDLRAPGLPGDLSGTAETRRAPPGRTSERTHAVRRRRRASGIRVRAPRERRGGAVGAEENPARGQSHGGGVRRETTRAGGSVSRDRRGGRRLALGDRSPPWGAGGPQDR